MKTRSALTVADADPKPEPKAAPSLRDILARGVVPGGPTRVVYRCSACGRPVKRRTFRKFPHEVEYYECVGCGRAFEHKAVASAGPAPSTGPDPGQ